MLKSSIFNKAIILITGGTGSWGNELTKQLLEKYDELWEIRIYSRNEHKQVDMRYNFANHPKIKFIIGDIRDKNILNYAMKGVGIVFHLAALKHVPVCEENSWEAVLTNINGTQNVIEAAINNKVKKVVDVSTDKAVDPFNLYGVTKACGEKLIINANQNYWSDTTFVCIRWGNVIGTAGSVIPLFKKQIEEHNEITITDGEMTRFLMKKSQAIGLLFQAVEMSIGGEVFVMNMPTTTVDEVADTMIRLYGNENTKKTIIGARAGEKKYEVLVSKNETPSACIINENYYAILPQYKDISLTEKYSQYKKFSDEEFNSNNARFLEKGELEKLVQDFFTLDD